MVIDVGDPHNGFQLGYVETETLTSRHTSCRQWLIQGEGANPAMLLLPRGKGGLPPSGAEVAPTRGFRPTRDGQNVVGVPTWATTYPTPVFALPGTEKML